MEVNMKPGGNPFSILFWGLTLILQWAFGMLVIFMFSLLLEQFIRADEINTSIWLLMLASIAVGFILGIWGVGELAYRLRRLSGASTPSWRLLFTTLGVILPLLILISLGASVGMQNTTRFKIQILDGLQPRLASAAPFTGLIGFYLPWGKKNKNKTENYR
jgi:hypothetical protein